MSVLQIRFFGGMDLRSDEAPLPAFPTQKAQSLFAYLVMQRTRMHSRDVLIGTFWGEVPEAVARKGLRTELWRIRSVLRATEAPGKPTLRVCGDQIGFNTDRDYWLDISEFEQRVQSVKRTRTLGSDDAHTLHEATQLYRGDLLDGHYESWSELPRERLQLMYVAALAQLMDYHEQHGAWTQAERTAQQILAADPTCETANRALMRCHYMQGNRVAALRQYGIFADRLRAELEVEPMDDTRALYEQIRHSRDEDGTLTRGSVTADAALNRAEPLLDQVETMLSRLYAATLELESARSMLRADTEVRSRVREHVTRS